MAPPVAHAAHANYSVFDVDSVQALHDLPMQLPLFPYDHEINALCRHLRRSVKITR